MKSNQSNQYISLHDVKAISLSTIKWAPLPDSDEAVCWRELKVSHAGGVTLLSLYPQRQGKELQLQVLTEEQIML
jgi:hypothetical protein